MTCKTCEYWHSDPQTKDTTTGQEAGNCHRYPPRSMPMPIPPAKVQRLGAPPFVMVSMHPATSANDFCGEENTLEDVEQ
jgi:hypothetical protein